MTEPRVQESDRRWRRAKWCTCGKQCHPTVLDALKQRAKLYAERGHRLRVYRCRCRHYHLTSQLHGVDHGLWPDCPAGLA